MTAILIAALLAVFAALTAASWANPPHVHVPRPQAPATWVAPVSRALPQWACRDRPPDWAGTWFGRGVGGWPEPDLSATPPVDLWAVNRWPPAYGGATAQLPKVPV